MTTSLTLVEACQTIGRLFIVSLCMKGWRNLRSSFWRLFALLLSVLMASCSAQLSDPRDILAQGMAATRQADSFRAHIVLDGSIKTGITPSLELNDVTLDGNFSLAGGRGSLDFEMPSLFDVSGEVRLIGKVGFARSSLTGPEWVRFPLGGQTEAQFLEPERLLMRLEQAIDDRVVLRKMADIRCGEDDCYRVEIIIPAEMMDEPVPVFGIISLPQRDLVLFVDVDKSSLLLRGLETRVDLEPVGNLHVTINLTDHGQSVRVITPDPDEVVDRFSGPAFPIDFPYLGND